MGRWPAAISIDCGAKKSLSTAPMLIYQHSRSGVSIPAGEHREVDEVDPYPQRATGLPEASPVRTAAEIARNKLEGDVPDDDIGACVAYARWKQRKA